jgi:y4mF family transcriptional regulator
MTRRNLDQLTEDAGHLANFVREHRKKLGYTQVQLAPRIGVGLRFIKELELGKKSLRMDKVEQVLNYFGHTLHAVPLNKVVKHDTNS